MVTRQRCRHLAELMKAVQPSGGGAGGASLGAEGASEGGQAQRQGRGGQDGVHVQPRQGHLRRTRQAQRRVRYAVNLPWSAPQSAWKAGDSPAR